MLREQPAPEDLREQLPAEPLPDLLKVKTEEVTAIERRWVIAWELAKAPDPRRAAAILTAGGNAEHYRAVLHEDKGQWTEGQRDQFAAYIAAFEAVERPAPAPPEDGEPPDRPDRRD